MVNVQSLISGKYWQNLTDYTLEDICMVVSIINTVQKQLTLSSYFFNPYKTIL